MTIPEPVADVLEGRERWAVIEGDCLEILPTLPERCVDHVITDPPYSRRVHENAETSRRRDLPDIGEFACRQKRRVEFGFEHLSSVTRRAVARGTARTVKRWALVFSDTESAWLWRISLTACGMNYRRTMDWDRLNGAPQFNGMEPAAASEAITLAHQPGRRRWNGGGKQGRYSFPVVQNRGGKNPRLHEAQKPLSLIEALVSDFTDPGDLVADWFCGSGTTGVACLRLGRRFIGIEREPKWAELSRERLAAEVDGSTLQARRAGQVPLFGGGK